MIRALEMLRAVGDPQVVSIALNFMSPMAVALGRLGEAEAFLKESLALCQQEVTGGARGLPIAFWAIRPWREANSQKRKSSFKEP